MGRGGGEVAEDIIVQKVWEIYLNWEIGGFEKKEQKLAGKNEMGWVFFSCAK